MGLSQVYRSILTAVCWLSLVIVYNSALLCTRIDKSTACYDELGCISTFNFTNPLLWPTNLLPESRPKINTYFMLYTKDDPSVRIIFFSSTNLFDFLSCVSFIPLIQKSPFRISGQDPDGIKRTLFRATRQTKFYIHGWLATGNEDRIRVSLELHFVWIEWTNRNWKWFFYRTNLYPNY